MNYQKSLSIFKKTLGGKSSTPTIYKSILNLTPTNRIRLLDIGIGDGTYLKRIINELLKAGFNVSVTGIDVCKSSLNIASKIFPNDVMINTEFENAKLNGKYDIIFMSHSFYYLKNKNRALKKILTHLSEGGLLIIILWSKKDSIYKLHNKLFTKNNKSPTLTAEDAYKLVLKNKKEFQKSKLIYFSGDVKFKKWRESTKVMRSSLEVISRIYPNSNESINLTKFKNELKNITDTGRRLNGIIIAKKKYKIKNLNRKKIRQILAERFPTSRKIAVKLNGDLAALFMSSWEKETEYICKQLPPGKILELCCAAGCRSVILAKKHKIVAIDINQNRINAAIKNSKLFKCSNKIKFICCDALDASCLRHSGKFSGIVVDTDWRKNLNDPIKKQSINPFDTTPRTDKLFRMLKKEFPNILLIFRVSPFARVKQLQKLDKCKIEEIYINNNFLVYNVYFSPKIKNNSYSKVYL